MGAVTGAVIGAVGALGGAAMQNKGAKDAARAQGAAAQLGIAEQQRQFDTFQENIQPYLGVGQQGVNRLAALASGDFSGFHESPEYAFARDQGLQALERGAAARGSMHSGGADADRMRFASGLASQEYGNHWNRLLGLAHMGQNAAVGAGSMGQQHANAVGNLLGAQGQAQAGGAINSANAWSNALSGLANVAGTYMGNRDPGAGRQSAYQSSAGGNWGAFTPNQGINLATTQPYIGQSAFGQWGRGWGG